MEKVRTRNFMIMMLSIAFGFQLWLFDLIRSELILVVLWRLEVWLNHNLWARPIKLMRDFVTLQNNLIERQDMLIDAVISIKSSDTEQTIVNTDKEMALGYDLVRLKSFSRLYSIYDPQEIEDIIDPTGNVFRKIRAIY